MQFIKNYFIGKKLCKKYGIEFSPWLEKHGYIEHWTTFFGVTEAKVKINLFDKYFTSTLLHEIGHYVDMYKIGSDFGGFKCVGRDKYYHKRIDCLELHDWEINGFPYFHLLHAEANASRFANRVGKGKDEEILLKAFRTYTRNGFKHIPSEKLDKFVTLCVKLENRIKYKKSR